MANTYCQDGYCELTSCKEETASSDKVIMVGYVLFSLALTAMVFYAVSIGIYIDPTSFN